MTPMEAVFERNRRAAVGPTRVALDRWWDRLAAEALLVHLDSKKEKGTR